MKIYKYFHSCLLLDDGQTRILFDPGNYSFIEGRAKIENLKNIDAVLITHSHGDHLDIGALKTIISQNSSKIISNSGTKEVLKKEGIDCAVIESAGFMVGNFSVKPVSSPHESSLRSVPENTAYIVNDMFMHPGDSINKNLHSFKVKVLALPIFAGWAKLTEFGDFAKAIKPETVIPIHDGIAVSAFMESYYKTWTRYFKDAGINFMPLRNPEEFLEI